MREKVDPIRLFDAKARPLSSYEAMERRIKLLERWNDRLLRMLRHKQRLEEPATKPASILN
jgi:cell shape-determining protein MreC